MAFSVPAALYWLLYRYIHTIFTIHTIEEKSTVHLQPYRAVVSYIAVVKSWHKGDGWRGTERGQIPVHIIPGEEEIPLLVIFLLTCLWSGCQVHCRHGWASSGGMSSRLPQLRQIKTCHTNVSISEISHAESADSHRYTPCHVMIAFLLLARVHDWWDKWGKSRSHCTNLLLHVFTHRLSTRGQKLPSLELWGCVFCQRKKKKLHY